MPPPSLPPERAKVAEFYSASSGTIPPLPWQTFPPPFSWRSRIEAKLEMETGRLRSRATRTLTLKAEGVTINRRPALTLESVQQWFSAAFNVVPEACAIAPIAQAINHCALLESQWRRTPELDEMRRSNPSMLRTRRIAEALATLQNDLPVLIEETREVIGDKQSEEGLVAVMALLDAVNLLAPGYEKFRQRAAGREVDPWHRIARNRGPSSLRR